MTRQLQRGNVGDDVKALQQRLRNEGENIEVDGIFGPKTEAALRRYQRAKGLSSDGIAGPHTGRALDTFWARVWKLFGVKK